MGVMKFLTSKGATPTGSQQVPPVSLPKPDLPLKKALAETEKMTERAPVTETGLPDSDPPRAASSKVGSNEAPAGILEIEYDEFVFTFDSQQPLDLGPSSSDQNTKDLKSKLQQVAASASKLREEVNTQIDRSKEKDPLVEVARSDKSGSRRKHRVKEVAVKPASIRFPVEAIEAVPLRSFDPVVAGLTAHDVDSPADRKRVLRASSPGAKSIPLKKPKSEASVSRADLEAKRVSALEKRVGEELAVGRQREEEERRKRIEQERMEAEEKKREDDLEKAKAEAEKRKETDRSESSVRSIPQSSPVLGKKVDEKERSRKKKRPAGTKASGKERKKKKVTIGDEVPDDGSKDSDLPVGTDKPGKAGEGEVYADTLLEKETQILSGGKLLSKAEKKVLHREAADRANTILGLRAGRLPLPASSEISLPVFVRPPSPVRRHESVIIETDDILLSHEELKRRRRMGDLAQKKQLKETVKRNS